jgi:hypothetical protein
LVKDQLDSIKDNPRIKTFVADQANRTHLQSFIDKHGADFDIVMDDGGHTMEMQQTSFGFFFKHPSSADSACTPARSARS